MHPPSAGHQGDKPASINSPHTAASRADNLTPRPPVNQLEHVVTPHTEGRTKTRLRPLVAASLGCYGAALADGSEYRGDYGKTIGVVRLREWHRERLDVLARAEGVDLVMFETVPCLEEVRAILSLLEVRKRHEDDECLATSSSASQALCVFVVA